MRREPTAEEIRLRSVKRSINDIEERINATQGGGEADPVFVPFLRRELVKFSQEASVLQIEIEAQEKARKEALRKEIK